MADNFTKFSFLIKNATKKEVAWLEEVLAFDFEDEQQRPFLLEMLHTSRGLESTFEYWPDFDHVLPDLTSRDPRARSLWVYAAESGNPWTAAVLVHAFLSKFRPKEIVRFSVAYTCSKMRPDEFSGRTSSSPPTGSSKPAVSGSKCARRWPLNNNSASSGTVWTSSSGPGR